MSEQNENTTSNNAAAVPAPADRNADVKTGIYAVIACIAIQLTLGIAYLWSLFQSGVAYSLFNDNSDLAGLTFSILLATLTIGSVFGGKLAARHGTRIVVFAGGVILSLGFLLAGFVTANTSWLLWFTYGAMGGIGMGFTYSTTIGCAQKWYPHKKGLITGVIVAALGFGGVIFTPAIEALLQAFGGDKTGFGSTFMVLAAIFFAVCSAGSFFLKNPPEGWRQDKLAITSNTTSKPAVEYTTNEMLRSPKFYLVIVSFLFAVMGGLMIINFARQLALLQGITPQTAGLGVMIIALFNSIGRVTWGLISDKIGRINTVIVLLAGSAALSLFVVIATGFSLFVLLSFIGFFFGGLLSTLPALTADLFGAKHFATNYGVVLLGFGAGAIIASLVGGRFLDRAREAGDINRMWPAFIISSSLAVLGIAMMLALKFLENKNPDSDNTNIDTTHNKTHNHDSEQA